MRVHEILREAAQFPDEGVIQDRHGRPYTVRHTPGDIGEHEFRVFDGDRQIGYARLASTGDHVNDVRIGDHTGDPTEHRRRGIASALYGYIEQHLGHPLVPSPTWRTPDGKAFWRSRLPGGPTVPAVLYTMMPAGLWRMSQVGGFRSGVRVSEQEGVAKGYDDMDPADFAGMDWVLLEIDGTALDPDVLVPDSAGPGFVYQGLIPPAAVRLVKTIKA